MKYAVLFFVAIIFGGCDFELSDEGVLSRMERPIVVTAIHKDTTLGGVASNATVRDAKGKFRICASWLGVQIVESYKVGDTLK